MNQRIKRFIDENKAPANAVRDFLENTDPQGRGPAAKKLQHTAYKLTVHNHNAAMNPDAKSRENQEKHIRILAKKLAAIQDKHFKGKAGQKDSAAHIRHGSGMADVHIASNKSGDEVSDSYRSFRRLRKSMGKAPMRHDMKGTFNRKKKV